LPPCSLRFLARISVVLTPPSVIIASVNLGEIAAICLSYSKVRISDFSLVIERS